MINFDTIAVEIFRILRSFNYELAMWNELGEQTYEPEQARRFFARPHNLTLAIMDKGENSSVQLGISRSTDINEVMGLIEQLRVTAPDFNLMCKVRKHDRELKPKDLAMRHLVHEGEDMTPINLTEGMYGTSKSSYLKLENARMIVRHSAAVAENVMGARSRNIDRIFIENALGERFLMPTVALGPARAMAQHCNHGGGFADEVGLQIGRLAQTFSDLGTCARHIYSNSASMEPEMMVVWEDCRSARHDMRRVFERLYRSYGANIERVMERARQPLDEGQENLLAENIERLKVGLKTDRAELDESVIESVARALVDREQVLTEDMINLDKIGYSVERAAWEAFKGGSIETTGPFVEGDTLTNNLRAVAEITKAPKFAEMLKGIADDLDTGSRDRLLRTIALRAVGAMKRLEENQVIMAEPIVEFQEWFDSLDGEQFGAEEAIEEDDAPVTIENDFDAAAFLDACGEDFDDSGSFPREYVKSSLVRYLEGADEDIGHEDAVAMADRLFPKVEALMGDRDLAVTEDEDFSAEDVILPGNAVDDLKAEVLSRKHRGDDGYVERMRKLAGVDGIRPPQF